jgi:hypothetical protein
MWGELNLLKQEQLFPFNHPAQNLFFFFGPDRLINSSNPSIPVRDDAGQQ